MARVKNARVGVVGAGWWATQHHIPSLVNYDRADLAGVAESDPTNRQKVAQHFDVPLYVDADEMFDVAQLDGAIIATPHKYHYPLAAAALDAGLHVLVEKPLALTAEHAWDLVRRAEKAGLQLMVGTTFQFTRLARRCRDALQGGEIGGLLHVNGCFSSAVESFFRARPADYQQAFKFPVTPPGKSTYSDPDIAGGGQGQTQLSHAMGMVLWATGNRAVEVSAFMENRDLRVDLVDAISYRLENGALGTMGATGSVASGLPQQQTIYYYGTHGLILQDLIGGTLQIHTNNGRSETYGPLPEDEIYPAELPARTLVDLILGNVYNPAPGRDAARTVEFLQAAYRSAAEGRVIAVESPQRTASNDR